MAGNRKPLRVLGCQTLVPDFSSLTQRDRHVSELCDRISKYLSERTPVDLVVLPELVTIPYSRETFESLPLFAETLSGASTEAFIELSQKINSSILFGMPYESDSRFFISQILVDPREGVVEIYSKMHLCHYGASCEKDFFEQGNKLITFDLCGWKVAPLICYDIRFPEMARSLVLEHGVDFLIHAAAYYRDESFATWPHFAVTRAMENQIFLLSLNRAGPDYGGSIFCPPWIDDDHPVVCFDQLSEEFQVLELNSDAITQARERYTFLVDRHLKYSV
ncbi:carbon-nitrogen hydrolase family protein [Gammaproteobacteria bacterium]|nr:carbon-nitrogen hydrolase family protein [Gammaproteobacteria bacterium]